MNTELISTISEYLKRHYGASDIEIKEALNEAVFQDVYGNMDSVVTVATLNKYDEVSTYFHIARRGLESYRNKVEKRNK